MKYAEVYALFRGSGFPRKFAGPRKSDRHRTTHQKKGDRTIFSIG